MFEKDIYQLIRGMRAHKGNEREYIQLCLKECRREVKGADMDQKATALLKLVYLEMFGHDMSWASFNVLEVMSSPKYIQKRVGYLAAVQSFRKDTEVLMLAENLLKKDVNSADKTLISLPLVAIPHVANPSMANSLLTDLLPRLSHSSPGIRKKTIVTLYRLALEYPETLRPAWPKIKERLLDEDEDPSVTAAIVNVVCELGWRRPQDFLPLAPRLFSLLTSGNNNWMAIKIIKLFSVLTPLEPRLVKKLLPPLTSIIETTPAMSLLYECINGIIQGGIMEAAEGTMEGDEVARLCLSKLRAMLVVEGDPNLRYVALLAFEKITKSHAHLVVQHSDVILECIDDPDISIRTRAIDLVVGMINPDNLQPVVERLLKQLRNAGAASSLDDPNNDRAAHDGVVPMADGDDADMMASIRPKDAKSKQAPPLPEHYRALVVTRILEMCSQNNYANMADFEWYIGVLVELVKQCPSDPADRNLDGGRTELVSAHPSVSDAIGTELQNVAVRVKGIRPEAAAAAQSLLLLDQREQLFPAAGGGGQGVLASCAFIAGEYAILLSNPSAVLNSLIDVSNTKLPAETLSSYLQAIPKLFIALSNVGEHDWSTTRKASAELYAARIIHFLEPLTIHPNLDVQERAVEYLDLMRLTAEAVSGHEVNSALADQEPPLLLTQAVPLLFSGSELNPVASSAVWNVTKPGDLDLDAPINEDLSHLLRAADYENESFREEYEVYRYYHEKPTATSVSSAARPAIELLGTSEPNRPYSYQDDDHLDEVARAKKKTERAERYRDDPYYIGASSGHNSGTSTPTHGILRQANGEGLDVDAIPVMELKLDTRDVASDPEARPRARKVGSGQRKPRRHFEIAGDETLGDDIPASSLPLDRPSSFGAAARSRKQLLEVDSSALSSLSLAEVDPTQRGPPLDFERRQAEAEEMARAIKEVERVRLEMQRAQEQIRPSNAPEDGIVVKRKKKKKTTVLMGEDVGGSDGVAAEVKKKTKKKKKSEKEASTMDTAQSTAIDDADGPADVPAKKKKKKRQVVFDE